MAYKSRSKLLVELCLKSSINREKYATGCNNNTNIENAAQDENTAIRFEDPSTPTDDNVRNFEKSKAFLSLENEDMIQNTREDGDSLGLLQQNTISGCYNTNLKNTVQVEHTAVEFEDLLAPMKENEQKFEQNNAVIFLENKGMTQNTSDGEDSLGLLLHNAISGCYNTNLENAVQVENAVIEFVDQSIPILNENEQNIFDKNKEVLENEYVIQKKISDGGDPSGLLLHDTISGCYDTINLENTVQDEYTVIEFEDPSIPINKSKQSVQENKGLLLLENEDIIQQNNSESENSSGPFLHSTISDKSEEEHYTPDSSDSSESEDLEPQRQRKRSNVQITVLRDEIIQNDEEVACIKQKELTRKRKRLPETWKRNKQKQLRLAGKEHLSQTGHTVRAKAVKAVLCKCHYNCNQNFSMQNREQIFRDYLSLNDDRSRWAFISKCVSKIVPKRRYAMANEANTASRRQHTLVYTLTSTSGKHQVCKNFFLATLDISGKKVEYAMKKTLETGIVEEDKRGLNPAPNKIPEDRREIVRCHIKSIPVVESHYCRDSSKRMYLPTGLSENRLYQDYLKYCEERHVIPVTSSFYKHIFTSEFNYGFHRPKKDQCDYCAQFKNKSEDEKLKCQNDLDLHLLRKQEAREHKKEDKERARNDLSFRSYTMDLEKILLTPQLGIGQLYYKRKLKTYNFTVYALADKNVINYMWHETDGTKGSSEVATCLWQLLSELPPEVSEVTFYSDTASGQNRNTILSAMFLRALSLLDNLKIINQKFMESGHSEMECDSVHSTIENRAKKIDIFVPDQWYTVARTAKLSNPPYVVKEINYSQFLNFKMYSQKLITNKNKNVDGNNMRWLDVKWLQFRKDSPLLIFYKYQLSENEFKQLCIRRPTRKENTMHTVEQLYQSRLPIDKKKLKDLLSLCQSNKIPSVYHQFYQTLDATVSTNADDSDEEI